jgi:methionyl-tRNA formyltransferase
MKSLRIVFMGTPEFAVASLGALLMNGFNVVGIVTSTDKPAGRGRKVSKSPVKLFAEHHVLPLLQPDNLKDPEFVASLRNLKPDVFIVVAFRMLPEVVWRIPRLGTINLHASLLPQYRGAAPINHAIINGEKITGLTTFLIDEKIDTGNILLREEIPVFPYENAGDLHDRLMKEGAKLIINTIAGIGDGSLKTVSQYKFMQPGEVLKTAPKISTGFCMIDWNRSATELHNFVRGLSPYPCARAFFTADEKPVSFRIIESTPEITAHAYEPGIFFSDGKSFLKVSCTDGYLKICSLQPEGRTRMYIADFLRGFRIEKYATLI